jgi:hypothetical protein
MLPRSLLVVMKQTINAGFLSIYHSLPISPSLEVPQQSLTTQLDKDEKKTSVYIREFPY